MSLAVAQSIATSALLTAQARISITSSNIANADTTGYTRKIATQSAQVTAGVGTGVAITGISTKVDKTLLASLMAADSTLGAATTTESYADQLQALYGSTSSDSDSSTGTSIANSLANLSTALTELSETPESDTLKGQVVTALDSLATQLRSLSSGIQSLRASADSEISTDVDTVNNTLQDVDDLNKEIASAKASGSDTSDLEDQRNTDLETLSSAMNVTWFSNSDGAVQIYTSGGQALLDGTVHELSFNAATTVTASSTYASGTLSGITVDGKDITSQISNGSISSLFTMRDETLPDAQANLDNLAVTLADTLNTVNNEGTSLPAASSLTGSTKLSSSDALSATGTARFAVVDDSGKLVSYGDIDLSTCSTVGDLVSKIDAIDGLSASLDSSGHLVVSADDSSNGVAVNEMTSSVGTSGKGLADWLGLNDLVTGTGASNFAVRSDILSSPSLLSTAQLDSSSSLTVGSTVVASGSTKVTSAFIDALSSKRTFASAGSLGASTTTFAGYAAEVIGSASTTYSNAESTLTSATSAQSSASDALSSASGVNVDEETEKLTELQNSYSAAAQILSVVNSLFTVLLDMVQSA